LLKKRKVTVIVVAAALVLVFAAVGAGLWIVNRTDNPVETITRKAPGGGGGASGSTTISIYAPSELSKTLEGITAAFQLEFPATTFQVTLGPSSELSARIRDGEKPGLYIDTVSAIDQVPANSRPKGSAPAAFGYDGVQLAVLRNNPKQVNGLNGFAAGSPITTGICAPELVCGRVGAQALHHVGVNPAPTVVTSNIAELTDGVKTGRIDAVLMLRTDLRRVLTKITNIPIGEASIRFDYQMLPLRSDGSEGQFIVWLQGAPSARHALRLAGMLGFYEG
jgi:molybdate transport system substrate-binding protein